MKKTMRIVAGLLALLMLLSIGACGNTSTDNPEAGTTEAASSAYNFFGADTAYKLVREENLSKAGITEFLRIKKAVQEKFQVEMPLSDDWVRDESEIGANEILFGNTNRPESQEFKNQLEGKGYLLAVKNGKLVIYANTDKAYTTAVNYIIEELIGKDVLSLEEGYFYTATESVPITGVTVNGVDLKDYTLTYKNKTQWKLPLYTADNFFLKYCGITVNQAAESDNVEGHKIVLGGTKADGSAYGQFEIEIYYKDGDLHLGCANATSAQQVLYTFFAKYLDKSGMVEITLPEDGTAAYYLDNGENWDDANPKCLTIQDRIIRSCYKLEEILELDMSHGIYFTYQGELGYKQTIAESRSTTSTTQNRTTNCVIVGNWVMKDAGFYTDGIYNHTYDGTTGWTAKGGAGTFFQQYMDVIDVRSENKSVRTLTKEGRILPGDIIGFTNHNQTILPLDYAFDGGRSSDNMYEAQTGGRFKHWVGPNPYISISIGFIFRSKDAE